MASKLECLFHRHTFNTYDPNCDPYRPYLPCIICGRVYKSTWSGDIYIDDKNGKSWYYKDVISGRVRFDG